MCTYFYQYVSIRVQCDLFHPKASWSCFHVHKDKLLTLPWLCVIPSFWRVIN